MGHVPKSGKGKQKTNRKEHSQPAPPERPDKSLRTRHGSKFSGTATRTGQRLSRCRRSQEHRYILPAPATERPRTSENTPVRGSNGCVRCARKSDPMNDRATPYQHPDGQWLCRPTARPIPNFRWCDSNTPCGEQAPNPLCIADHHRSVHPTERINRLR